MLGLKLNHVSKRGPRQPFLSRYTIILVMSPPITWRLGTWYHVDIYRRPRIFTWVCSDLIGYLFSSTCNGHQGGMSSGFQVTAYKSKTCHGPNILWLGQWLGLLKQSPLLVSIFFIILNTLAGYRLIMLIFDSCLCSSAVETPVKYGCDLKNLTSKGWKTENIL